MERSQRRLRCEVLENRLLLSVTMTDYEQLMFYYINRARVDPPAEAARFGIDLNDGLDPGTISPTPKQPLIPNQILRDVAGGHSQDMLDRDYFAHQNPEGKEAVDRAQAAGYPTKYVGENISWEGTTGVLDPDPQVAARHESLFRSAVHRTNTLHDLYQEVGVGIRFGPFTDTGTTYNAAMVTQNFGRRNADTHLVGVVYDDTNENGVFDLHEGLANVTIDVGGQNTTTNASGGWFLQVSPGTHEVTVSGSGYVGTATSSVTTDDQNVELDFISDQSWGIVNFVNPVPPDIVDLGTVDYRHLEQLDLSGGDLWLQMDTARSGLLTFETVAAPGSTLTLYDSSLEVIASSTKPLDEARIDVPANADERFYVTLSGPGQDVDLRVANLVTLSGTEVRVAGTAGLDHFEFAPTVSYLVTINGVGYDFDDALYETIVFDGASGNDVAALTGGSGKETARFFPDHGTFGENGFLVTVNDVAAITAHGGGGPDEAYLYDSPGNDEFRSHKGYGKLSGDGFVLETFDFMFNYGYATTRDGGHDTAYMEDAPTADKFKFDWPKPGQFFGKMYGGGSYYNRAKNFEKIGATMTDGTNTVRLFDSEGNETFYGRKDESRLVGAGFEVAVTGYDSLAAYASKGTDIARFEDSADNDTTRARPNKIVLWGGADDDPTYTISARRFDEYHFAALHGGKDRAKLHDTAFSDHADARGNSASLYADTGGQDLLYEVVAFEWVKLYGSGNDNRDTVKREDPLAFDLVYNPAIWDEVL